MQHHAEYQKHRQKPEKPILHLHPKGIMAKGMAKHPQAARYQEVKDETASVAAQVKEEKEKQQEFEARREYYTSDAYIEQIAREQLGMVKSNEILYINRGE